MSHLIPINEVGTTNAHPASVVTDHRKGEFTPSWWRRALFVFLADYGVALLLVPLVIIFTTGNENFLTLNNLLNIGRQIAVFGIIGVGMTLLLLLAHVDLSVGSVVAFTGVITAVVAEDAGITVGILAALVTGAVIGGLNGFFTVKFALPALLVTLASLTIFRGLAFVVTNGRSVTIESESFRQFGNGVVLGIPNFVWVLLIVTGLGAGLLAHTPFGRHVYAAGGNMDAARRAGIRVDALTIVAFAITGFLAGLAGVLLASRLASAQPIAGQGYELAVIAAVVLGGTSLFGGHGKVAGTLLGALVLGTLQNGMDLLAVTPYVQTTIVGLTILVALLADSARRRYIDRIRRTILGGGTS